MNKLGIGDKRWKSRTRHIFVSNWTKKREHGYIAKYRRSTYTMHLEEIKKFISETMATFDMFMLRPCFQDVKYGG